MSIKKKGFTLIEVVLVLAVTGIIFLAVFIAYPSLMRSQNNLWRQRAMQRMMSATVNYMSHNNKLPFTISDTEAKLDDNFINRYVDESCQYDGIRTDINTGIVSHAYTNCTDQFLDPDGTPFKITLLKESSGPLPERTTEDDVDYIIYVSSGSICGQDEGTREASEEPKMFTISYRLAGGSVFCIDNK